MLRWFLMVTWVMGTWMWTGMIGCSPNISGNNQEQHGNESQSTDTGPGTEPTSSPETTSEHVHDAGGMGEHVHDAGGMGEHVHDAGGMGEHIHDAGGMGEHVHDAGGMGEHVHDAGGMGEHVHDAGGMGESVHADTSVVTEHGHHDVLHDAGGSVACKHDCDCVKLGWVCDAGICKPLRRMSLCVPCDGGHCKPGDPCVNKDQSIGVCPAQTFACGAKTCKLGQEYCTTTVGGARPTCDVLPPVVGNCPTGCSDAGLSCADGKTRCTCPSTQCNALPTGCSTCACLTSGGGIPPSACQCSEQNGAIQVKCFAP